MSTEKPSVSPPSRHLIDLTHSSPLTNAAKDQDLRCGGPLSLGALAAAATSMATTLGPGPSPACPLGSHSTPDGPRWSVCAHYVARPPAWYAHCPRGAEPPCAYPAPAVPPLLIVSSDFTLKT